MRKKIFSFLILAISIFIYSEDHINDNLISLSISEYLFSDIIIEQKILDTYSENIKYLNKSSFNIPYIDDIQIRTRTDEFNFNYQETSIRFSPKIFGIENAENKLFESYASHYDNEKKIILLKNLKKRYLNIIDNTTNRDLLQLYIDTIKLYKDLLIIKKNSINDFSTLEELIKIEDSITKLEFKSISVENEILNSNAKISYEVKNSNLRGTENNFIFTSKSFIEVKDIKDLFKHKFYDSNNNLANIKKIYDNNLLLKKEQNRYNIELNRYEIDKKRSSKNFLSFLELSYDNKYYYEKGKIDDAFSVGIGMSLSFLKTDASYLKRRYINVLKEKSNLEVKLNDLSYEFSTNISKIGKLIEQYIYLQDRINNSYAQLTIDNYADNIQIDPSILLETKIKTFKNKILLMKLKKDILDNYIDTIYLSGLLNESILKKDTKTNFLEIQKE